MRRRAMLAGAAGASVAATGVLAAPARAAAAGTPAGVILIGANPGVSLFNGEQLSAFASVWVVRWSERGSGRAIVLWHDAKVRVLATDAALGDWLSQYFTRNFPEVAGIPWPDPVVQRSDVDVRLDMASGLRVPVIEASFKSL